MAALLAALAPACRRRPTTRRAPITLIVPFAAGGPTDIIARILAQSLSQSLGQSVIVDNRAGGGGNLGMALVARANPDGYTLLLTSTAIAVNPGLFANLPYDPIKDFAPISELVNAPNVLFVQPDSGITSIADLVAKAKAEPNKFNYASPGVGTKSHLTGELLKLRAGINIQHIPYRGGGPATQALVAGTVQLGSVALAPVEPLIKSGTVRALAVTGANALVVAAGRSDHDRVRLSRASSPTPSMRCSRPPARRRRSWRCWCEKRAPRWRSPRRRRRRAAPATKSSQAPPRR